MRNYLVDAVYKLRPSAEFVIRDNDYSTIEWHVLEGAAPTHAEVDSTIAELIAADEASIVQKAAARAALLERLGITEDEAKLLG